MDFDIRQSPFGTHPLTMWAGSAPITVIEPDGTVTHFDRNIQLPKELLTRIDEAMKDGRAVISFKEREDDGTTSTL